MCDTSIPKYHRLSFLKDTFEYENLPFAKAYLERCIWGYERGTMKLDQLYYLVIGLINGLNLAGDLTYEQKEDLTGPIWEYLATATETRGDNETD